MADFSELPDEEIVKIESRLFKMYSQLAAIVDSSDDAIIGADYDLLITSWNRGAEDIYGYSLSEVIRKNIEMLWPENNRVEISQLRKRILQKEQVKNYETRHISKSGDSIIVSLTLSPVKDPADNIIGFSLISRDITKEKETEEKLNKYNEIDRLNRLMVDREIAMIDLKKQIAELKSRLKEKEA